MWETKDPDGRGVVLTDDAWQHIVDRHPYFKIAPESILAAVAMPDDRLPGPETGEEWFYGSGAGPARWFRVVVHFREDIGYIVTAFPRRSLP